MKKLILAGLVAATFGSISIPASAKTDIIVNIGPPPVRYEVVPAPRVGSVWIPGYWEWRGHKHHWIAGHWARERRGYYYEPARWVEHDGRWRYIEPAWRRGDRDHDGVPDAYDRHPNNPNRS